MTLQQQIELGKKVTDLMNTETFGIVMTSVEAEIHETWERQKDPAEREACWQHLQGLKRFWRQMEILIERGTTAERETLQKLAGQHREADQPKMTRDEKRLTTLS